MRSTIVTYVISHIYSQLRGGAHSTPHGPYRGGTQGQSEQLEAMGDRLCSTKGCALSYCGRLWLVCLIIPWAVRKLKTTTQRQTRTVPGLTNKGSCLARGPHPPEQSWKVNLWLYHLRPFWIHQVWKQHIILDLNFRLCTTSPNLPSPSSWFSEIARLWLGLASQCCSLGALMRS